LLAVSFLAGLCLQAHAQYSINWFVFQGGGGQSEAAWGTPYTLTGTLGPSQGTPPATGGAFALTGLFFAQERGTVVIPQQSLTVTRNPDGTVTVSWPILSTGYVVEQSSTLSPGSWAPAPYNVNHNGVIRWITVQPAASRMFFRLRKA
jgi:hypothetical protein